MDHTQSISLNEFAQAIEHMRLKFSFDDVKKLFRYLDKSGNGDIGYDEFTMLLEERWRNIDPYKEMHDKMTKS
jgi:Ca2+-binding EF-hand superfamily protein